MPACAIAVPQMPLAMARRGAENAERGVWSAEQPDTDQDEGAEQENACGRPQQPHQPSALTCGVGEDGTVFRWQLTGVW
jgi:hypothetical protein